jgi:hypothetical protein
LFVAVWKETVPWILGTQVDKISYLAWLTSQVIRLALINTHSRSSLHSFIAMRD